MLIIYKKVSGSIKIILINNKFFFSLLNLNIKGVKEAFAILFTSILIYIYIYTIPLISQGLRLSDLLLDCSLKSDKFD